MPDVASTQTPLPRQRWRIEYRRDEDARFLAHLDVMKLWERALRRGGIPVAQTAGMSPRPRIVFAAPLPLGMLADAEIVDVVVHERLTVADLRRRLAASLPPGFELVDLYDVWLHAPAVAAQLAGAVYRLDLAACAPVPAGGDYAGGAGAPVTGDAVRAAAARLLAAERLDRTRKKEKRTVAYDLRPLIVALEVVDWVDAAGPADGVAARGPARPDGTERAGGVPLAHGAGTVRVTLRHSQDEGTGRPDEIVAALAEAIPATLEIVSAVRERLILAEGA